MFPLLFAVVVLMVHFAGLSLSSEVPICAGDSCAIPRKAWLPAALTLEPLLGLTITPEAMQALFNLNKVSSSKLVSRLTAASFTTMDDLADLSASDIRQLGLQMVLERKLFKVVSTILTPDEYFHAFPSRAELCNEDNSRNLMVAAQRAIRARSQLFLTGTSGGEYLMLMYDMLRRARTFCKHGLTLLQGAELHRDLYNIQGNFDTSLPPLCNDHDDRRDDIDDGLGLEGKQRDDVGSSEGLDTPDGSDGEPTGESTGESAGESAGESSQHHSDGHKDAHDRSEASSESPMLFGNLDAAKILLSYDKSAGRPQHGPGGCKEATMAATTVAGKDHATDSPMARCFFSSATSASA